MSGSQAHSVTLTAAEWQLVHSGLMELNKAIVAVSVRLQTQLTAQAQNNGELPTPPRKEEAAP